MDTIKKSIGLGGANEPVDSGQEPVSGEAGQGTAVEPYDAGNLPDPDKAGEAPQNISNTNGSSSIASEGVAANAMGPTSGRSVPVPDAKTGHDSSTTAAKNAEETVSSKETASSEKPSIGSAAWFKTAVPPAQRQGAIHEPVSNSYDSTNTDPKTTANGAANAEPTESRHSTKDLPPNQIGFDPPPGQSNELDTNTYPPADTGAATSSSAAPGSDGVATDLPEPKEGHPISSQMRGSKAAAAPVEKANYSNAPLKPVETASHGRRTSIPTAGGVALGSVASEARDERRRSVDARRKSRETGSSADHAREGIPEEKVPDLPKQPETQGSVAANSAPPLEGEAGPAPTIEVEEEPSPRTSLSKTKTTTAELVPPDNTPDGKSSTAHAPEPPSQSTSTPETSSGKAVSTPSPGGEKDGRRKSLFSKLKDKMKH